MKKSLKYVGLVLVCLLALTGCKKGKGEDKKVIKEVFDKTVINTTMVGYKSHLVLSGMYNGSILSNTVQVSKYKNQIKIETNEDQMIIDPENPEGIPMFVEKYTLYDGEKAYYYNGEKYTELDEYYYYEPDNLLKLLDSYKEIEKVADTTVGKNKYPTYRATISKENMMEALKDTRAKDLKLDNDVIAEVVVDNEGNIWQVNINLTADLYINASYYLFNGTSEVPFTK